MFGKTSSAAGPDFGPQYKTCADLATKNLDIAKHCDGLKGMKDGQTDRYAECLQTSFKNYGKVAQCDQFTKKAYVDVVPITILHRSHRGVKISNFL